MLTVAVPKRNKLQNIIVLTPKDGSRCFCFFKTYFISYHNFPENKRKIQICYKFPLDFLSDSPILPVFQS